MKSFALFSAAVLAVDAAAIERRQANLGLGLFQSLQASLKTPVIDPSSSKSLKPETFEKATRQQFTFGPFKLNPADGKHTGGGLKLDANSDMIQPLFKGLCENCMVLRANAEVTDKDGKRIGLESGVYTHHILIAEHGRSINMAPLRPTGTNCGNPLAGLVPPMGMMGKNGGGSAAPKNGGMGMGHSHGRRQSSFGANFSIFVAKGNEGDVSIYAPLNDTDVKSGYWIGKDSKMTAVAEVINYKQVEQEVYISIDLEYMKDFQSRPANYLDVGFGTIMVDSCNGLNLAPPKDRPITYTSQDRIATANGYIVGFVPHLHDGGLNLKLVVNDKVACASDAVYGKDGGTSINGEVWETINSYTPCRDPIKIRTGDKVKIVSDYDLTKRRLRPDSGDHSMEAEAMALGLFQFAREK